MTTVGDLVTDIKAKLVGVTGIDQLAYCTGAVGSGTGLAALTELGAARLGAGAMLAWEYERLLLGDYDEGLTSWNLLRGQFGSTAAAHAAGSLIEVNPRYPGDQVVKEIANEIRSWPKGLYAVDTTTVAMGAAVSSADLVGASGRDVYKLLSATAFPDTTSAALTDVPLRLVRGMAPATYASGYAVQLDPGVNFGRAGDIRVTYGYDFGVGDIDPTDDLEADLNIPASMHDIIAYGVGARMLAGKDALRNETQAQGQQRNAAEVPTSSWAKTTQLWMMMRDRRISEERVRLVETYGWVQR